VASRLRILKAFLRSRGPAWLGGILLNSFALVLTTRPALAISSGWSSWLTTPTLVGGLGLSLWWAGLSRLRCSLALAGVDVTGTRVFGAVILLFLSSLVTTSDFLRVFFCYYLLNSPYLFPRAEEKGKVHPGRDPLYPGKADLEQEVATCLSSPFETEFFDNSGSQPDWLSARFEWHLSPARGAMSCVGREEVGSKSVGRGYSWAICRRRQHKRDVGTATAQIPAGCPGLLIYASCWGLGGSRAVFNFHAYS